MYCFETVKRCLSHGVSAMHPGGHSALAWSALLGNPPLCTPTMLWCSSSLEKRLLQGSPSLVSLTGKLHISCLRVPLYTLDSAQPSQPQPFIFLLFPHDLGPLHQTQLLGPSLDSAPFWALFPPGSGLSSPKCCLAPALGVFLLICLTGLKVITCP